jgi:prevent-host-death family protein
VFPGRYVPGTTARRGGKSASATLCVMSARARVGIRELRQNLSVYLRRVGRGETLEVTERGSPVALLMPIPQSDDPIARLEAEGRLVSRASRRLEDLGPPLQVPAADISGALEEQREDRF